MHLITSEQGKLGKWGILFFFNQAFISWWPAAPGTQHLPELTDLGAEPKGAGLGVYLLAGTWKCWLNEWMVRYGSERTAPGSKRILEVSCLAGDGYFLNLLASLTLETKCWSDPFQNWSSNTPSPAAPPPSVTGPFTRLQPPTECLCHITHFFFPLSFCFPPLGQAIFWI